MLKRANEYLLTSTSPITPAEVNSAERIPNEVIAAWNEIMIYLDCDDVLANFNDLLYVCLGRWSDHLAT